MIGAEVTHQKYKVLKYKDPFCILFFNYEKFNLLALRFKTLKKAEKEKKIHFKIQKFNILLVRSTRIGHVFLRID